MLINWVSTWIQRNNTFPSSNKTIRTNTHTLAGATHGHVCQVAAAAYHSQGQSGVQPVARNQNDHRLYVQYIQQPTATNTGHLSDSASTDDSGISLSLEHSRGGPTPPGGHGTLTASFDRISDSSGSSTHLDVTSTTSKHHGADTFHQAHVQEVAVYQTGEIYGSVHVPMPSSCPSSQQAFAASGPKWVGGGGGKGEPTAGSIWLKPSSVGLVESGLVGGGAIASRKQQLLYGMFSRYEDGSRWQCEECKKLFSSQGSLRAHARIHTGERPYQCQFCCRTFCQASTLRSHERLHTGEKPYKCEHCGRAFTQSAGLRSHLKTHRYDSWASAPQQSNWGSSGYHFESFQQSFILLFSIWQQYTTNTHLLGTLCQLVVVIIFSINFQHFFFNFCVINYFLVISIQPIV